MLEQLREVAGMATDEQACRYIIAAAQALAMVI